MRNGGGYVNKAIFLDRDGTINIDTGYVYKIEDFRFIDGVIQGLKYFQDEGFLLIVITNQSGIARGYYTEEDYHFLNTYMYSEFEKYGIHITKDYYCPHLPDAIVSRYSCICNCRKPGTELFYKAVNEFNIDLSQSYCIGDKLRDLSICGNSDCRGFLIGQTESDHIIEEVKTSKYRNITYCNTLSDVVAHIKVI